MAVLVITAAVLVPAGGAGAVPAGSATFTEYPTGTYNTDMTVGPQGNLWFNVCSYPNYQVGRITPTGTVTMFPTVDDYCQGSIALGPDGNLWETSFDRVAKVTPAGAETYYVVPGGGPIQDITAGPDGNMWFTTYNNNSIGRITLTGDVTQWPVPEDPYWGTARPQGITAGPDGNLWFTEFFGEKIGRITPAGVMTEFPIPNQSEALPKRITAGPDGNLWFTEYLADKIGRITTAGVITEFPLPTSGAQASAITAGPDGNLWFVESALNRLGRITPAGVITEIHGPPSGVSSGLVTGPDGKLWFTTSTGVAKFDPSSVQLPPGPCLVVKKSITLTRDIGPCAGDGIVVQADNVTINLNGHQVRGVAGRTGDYAGIRIGGVHGVTVKGGTVKGFDAGVLLAGGGGHTITNMTLRDNLGAQSNTADLGDGIAIFHSADNRILSNLITHNGIYDGIGILGLDSNNNLVRGNRVTKNTDDGTAANFGYMEGEGTGIIINAFLDPGDPRRGESLHTNNIVQNVVVDNTNSGISTLSNQDAIIRQNLVRHNGFLPDGSISNAYPSNGIGLQSNTIADPLTRDLVSGNRVQRNAHNGIDVLSHANRLLGNQSIDNGQQGSGFDLLDENLDCDSNTWSGNTWGSAGYSPACTAAGGTGPAVAAATRSAPAAIQDRGESRNRHDPFAEFR